MIRLKGASETYRDGGIVRAIPIADSPPVGGRQPRRAQITELPAAEKAKWVNGLPNIVAPWLQGTGDAGKQVLKAYFDELRARGVKPLRDWDLQNR